MEYDDVSTPKEMRQQRLTSGTMPNISCNVRDGCGRGLHSVVLSLKQRRVDAAILQKIKIAKANFVARSYRGYIHHRGVPIEW